MANTYTWKVVSMDCTPSEDGKTNVVKTVHWTLDGTDDTHHAHVYGSVGVSYDAEADFTEYASLTEETVLNWVWASSEDFKATTEASVDSQLEALANPVSVTPELPF